MVAGWHFRRVRWDGILVFMRSALEVGFRAAAEADAERRGQRRAELLHIGNPVADARDVERTARHHVGLEAVLLRFLQRARELQELAHREVRLDGGEDFLDDARQLRDDGRRRDLVHAGLHEFLLALDAADVTLLVTEAHIRHGRLAVHMLLARAQVDDEAAVVIPGILVVHALLDVDVDAADGVDDFLERMRIDDDVVIHVDAEEILDRALRELLAAISVGRVDLIPAVAVDFHARVARDGQERRLILLRIDRRNHQRVGAADIVLALIDAHDHDGRLILRHQEAFLDFPSNRAVEERIRSEHGARDGRAEEAEEDDHPRPDACLLLLRAPVPRRDGIVAQNDTFFSI